MDALRLIATSVNNEDRSFIFNSADNYVIADSDKIVVAPGNLHIKGIVADDGSLSILDATGINDIAFDIANGSNMSVKDTKIIGNEHSLFKTAEGSKLTIDNVYIDGNINNSDVDIIGSGATIDGLASSSNMTLQSGVLRFNTDTFEDNGHLTAQNGKIDFVDNNIDSPYYLAQLVSNENVNYAIDLDLSNELSDSLILTSTGNSGIVTISELNFINFENIERRHNFITSVLNDTNKENNIQLAIADSIAKTKLKDISRIEEDQILEVTDFSHKYYNRKRNGELYVELGLATTNTSNDSLSVNITEDWEDTVEIVSYKGGTLKLVNQSEQAQRVFQSSDASEIYNVMEDLGKTATGNMIIQGTSSDDQRSTVDLRNHSGFEVGKDTILTVNDARISGNEDIINVTDSSAIINLSNAYINGNIKGSTNFNINVQGLQDTTINGIVENGNLTLSKGGIFINEDTFASANSTLNVEAGNIYLNNKKLDEYNIHNLVSSDKGKYSIDVDLDNMTADHINVSNGSGIIVIEEMSIMGSLKDVGIDDDYTIQILNSPNSDIQLQLSETALSQLDKDVKLGVQEEILRTDEVMPVTHWDKDYYQTIQEYDIWGRLNLTDKVTKNDSLHLYHLYTDIGRRYERLGDTLKLLSQLETESDRNFVFDSASNVYNLRDNIGDVTQGNYNITGVAGLDGNSNPIVSTINMNKHSGFNLNNDSVMTVQNVNFTHSALKDGSLFNIENPNTVLNLDNVQITDTLSTNAIINSGTINMTGGNILLDSGISGLGITNIEGANVHLGDGVAFAQSQVNVNSGSLTLGENNVIRGSLKVATNGSVTLVAKAITSSVVNDGSLIFTDGNITKDISGDGVTYIDGTIVNNAQINNDVSVNTGSLKTSANSIGGEINNDALLILTGDLDKNVSGSGTTDVDETLRLSAGAGFDGILNLNDGNITTKDSILNNYNIGTLLNSGTFSIDADFANNTSDKFIVGNNSKGTIYINEINFINLDSISNTTKIQILDTNGSDNTQLALNPKISDVTYKTGRTSRNEQDLVKNITNYKDLYYNYIREGDLFGNLVLGTTATTNDSIEIAIDESKTTWDTDRTKTTSMGDSLVLWNQLESEDNKEFIIDEIDTYVVTQGVDLGETKGTNVSLNGVATTSENHSTIDLNGNTGFELSNATTFNINNIKLTGTDTLISSSNTSAIINIKDSYIDGNILGSGNTLNISGNYLTTLNGTLNDIQTTLNSGSLKFNTDTFANSDDTLNVYGGSILMQNDKAEHYVINQLTSNENAKYSIDIDLSTQSADTIKTNTASRGSVVLDSLNILGTISSEDLAENYKIKILDTQNSDLQLALSDKLQTELSKTEYLVKTQKYSADSSVNAVNNWQDKYYQVDTVINYYGTLGLATSTTTNDSLGINITRNDSDTAQGQSMGDTLTLLNKLETEVDREFNFDDAHNVYNLSSDLGTTSEGTLTINGVSNGESEKSTVNLNTHSGFELSNDTTLNINNTKLTGSDTLISADNTNATINIKDSYIDGDIVGSGNSLTISGSDVTTLNSTLSDIETSLNSGSLKFNTDTFANSDNILNANSGSILLSNNQIENYVINQLTSDENVKYSIDIDLANKTADTITNNLSSSGVITIDNINFTGNETPSKEFTVKILNTIDDSIQLALSEKYTNQKYNLGEAHEQWNDLKASIYADEYFNKYERYGIRYGSLKLATTSTENDSITLNYDKTEWGNTTTSRYLDTLKELNQYVVNPDKGETERDFNFKDSSLYLVKEDLGVSSDGIFNINGVSNDSAKSIIDLDNHYGFELNNSTTLNLKDIKLTGNSNLITASNSNALINITNSYIDGNITANNNNITITGDSLTTLNGTITNAHTKLENGSLKFNTNTFSDSQDSLTASNGSILLSNNNIENYIINSLTSDENVKYSIDINFDNKTADMLTINNGTGIVTLDNLNITGSITNPNEEYKIQILDVKSGDIQLALSENTASELGKDEYILGTSTTYTLDKVKNVTNWKDSYNKYKKDITTFGKLDLAKTNTENDSIGIKITKVEEGELKFDGSQGDTLRVVNNSIDVQNKIFEFDTSKDEYDVKENLGETTGSLVIKGVKIAESSSTIDFNEHSGFEINKNSGLNIIDTELKNARAKCGSVMNVQSSDAVINLTNVSLLNNTAVGEKGGAIYSNSDINFKSDNSNIVIRGNRTHNDNEAIYLGKDAKLTLNTVNNAKLQIYDKINGESGYQTLITGDSSGDVYLNSKINNSRIIMEEITLHLADNNHLESSSVKINSGTLDLVNNKAQHQFAKTFNIAGDFKLNADVDLKNVSMDRLPANTSISKDAFINVDKLNLISDTNAYSVAIPFAYRQFKDNVKYIGPKTLSKETQVTTAYAPIFKYDIRYENRNDLGYFVFKKGGGFSPSESGAYNPAILASPVASQAGGFVAMNETFNYAFEHSKTFSMLPRAQRLAMFNSNKYSITDINSLHPMDKSVNSTCWVKPYANFESIGLANGPKVNITSYGTLAGGDSEFKTLRNGWGTVTTAYIGYNGSNQNYTGVSTSQNGGLIGLTQTFYKNNFFTAITASAGASVGESKTMYGQDNFSMLLAGVASKSGYNLEFKEGKYIIQPQMLLSYTYVNTFDYTNAAGVRLNSDPLHTIQIHPGIKFAANLKNGWQPYAGAGVVWNILNDTRVTADNAHLPEMSIKPYAEYGFGIQKRWKDSFTADLSAMLRNGGRNGITLTASFRWILGKENKSIQTVNNKNNNYLNENRKVVKKLDLNKNNTTKTSNKAILKQL